MRNAAKVAAAFELASEQYLSRGTDVQSALKQISETSVSVIAGSLGSGMLTT